MQNDANLLISLIKTFIACQEYYSESEYRQATETITKYLNEYYSKYANSINKFKNMVLAEVSEYDLNIFE